MSIGTRSENKAQVVTLRQIAEFCGVATSTAQRALAGKADEVSEATLRRILAAADELGYNPNHHYAARRLFANRLAAPMLNQTVALMFPEEFYHDTDPMVGQKKRGEPAYLCPSAFGRGGAQSGPSGDGSIYRHYHLRQNELVAHFPRRAPFDRAAPEDSAGIGDSCWEAP